MKNGICVIGTDTGVGKTVVSAGLALALRGRGVKVGVMKPIASGCQLVGKTLVSDDAVFLMEAAQNQFPRLSNPVRLREPLAPSVAAEIEEQEINVQNILFAFRELTRNYDFVIVEGVGGLLVPLRDKYFMSDLVKDLDLSVLLVGRISLGTINHTLLTIEAMRARGLDVMGFILNGLDPQSSSLAELTNPRVIETLAELPLLGVLPRIDLLSVERAIFGDLQEAFEKSINIDILLEKYFSET